MRDWIYSSIAVAPMGLLVASIFDATDWQAWALLTAAFWWARIVEYASKDDTQPESKPHALPSDKAVYDFCRSIRNETKGPTPELRKAYDLYKKKANAGSAEPLQHSTPPTPIPKEGA